METPEKVGPTGQRVAENVKRLRGHLSLRGFSAALAECGRRIIPSGILKIERGQRRVDVDDLVALAAALGTTPNRLLLPEHADETVIELTPTLRGGTARSAWEWAEGQHPLTAPDSMTELVDFRRRNRPLDPDPQETLNLVMAIAAPADRPPASAPLFKRLQAVHVAARKAMDDGIPLEDIVTYLKLTAQMGYRP